MDAYGYDFRNLMTDYDGPGTTNDTTYRYDVLGRRVTKNVNGTKTAYVHDGLNTVAEYNGSNQLQRTYVTPGLDQNLTMTASGNTYFYLTDALGSIRQVIDADQATQNSYDYQAFGSVFGSPTENLTQPFRFTGREWDGESSLYYYRARYYRAEIGRFLTRDHLAGLGYPYVGNAPLEFVDPTGMTTGRNEKVTKARRKFEGDVAKSLCMLDCVNSQIQFLAANPSWQGPNYPGLNTWKDWATKGADTSRYYEQWPIFSVAWEYMVVMIIEDARKVSPSSVVNVPIGEGFYFGITIGLSGEQLAGALFSGPDKGYDAPHLVAHELLHKYLELGHRGGWDKVAEALFIGAWNVLKDAPVSNCCYIPPNDRNPKTGKPGKPYKNRWEYCSCVCGVAY